MKFIKSPNILIWTVVAVTFPFVVNATQLQSSLDRSGDSLSFDSITVAQQPPDAPPETNSEPPADRINRLLRQLDLTPEQLSQIKTITEKSRSENSTIRQELDQNRQQLTILFGTDASTTDLQTQHQKVQNLSDRLSNNQFMTILEIREVLTPEQKTKLAELMKARFERKDRHQRQQ